MGHRHPRSTPIPPANRANSQPRWPLVDWASLWFDPSCAHQSIEIRMHSEQRLNHAASASDAYLR
jgi:hypothetical protein